MGDHFTLNKNVKVTPHLWNVKYFFFEKWKKKKKKLQWVGASNYFESPPAKKRKKKLFNVQKSLKIKTKIRKADSFLKSLKH